MPLNSAQLISNYVGFVETEFVMDTLSVSPKYCAQLTNKFISSTMEFVSALAKLGYIQKDLSQRDFRYLIDQEDTSRG
jgi:NitT/TauT family transport system substrate-binding protein